MIRPLIFILSLLLIAAAPPKRPVIVSIPSAPTIDIAAGGKAQYELELKIMKGYHIQANPASEEFLIAVTPKLQPVDGIKIGQPIYPKGVPFRLKSSKKDISTYENSVVIKIPLEADAAAKKGVIALKGTLRYQGCDAEICFPPVNLPFEAKLNIQ
jgi:uncharacterized protein